eukprot:GCRY01000692.1.p1 GENE.GCRY01000692.1~~GCRY01000692.1.p1  ORF type:complete len:388 (+),score=65.61 GCRY01000692.1:182-1345(+)
MTAHSRLFLLVLIFPTIFGLSLTPNGKIIVDTLEVSELHFSTDPLQVLSSPVQYSFLGSSLRPSPNCSAIYEEAPFLPSGEYWIQESLATVPQRQFCSREVDSNILGTRSNPAASCLEILEKTRSAPSGLYYLQAANIDASLRVFCDMETDGGGWALLSKFEQNSCDNRGFPAVFYADYFDSASWIKGAVPQAPTTPTFSALMGHQVVESHDWRGFFHKDRAYHLRQQAVHVGKKRAVDVYFRFHYPGFVVQDDAFSTAARGWLLTDRTVIRDDYAIDWYTSGPTYFWPPFSTAILGTGDYYTGCQGFSYGTNNCAAEVNSASRRFGNAGIIVDDGTDPANGETATSFVPHTNSNRGYTIVFNHQITDFQLGTAPMQGIYWTRPVRP